MRFPQRRRVPTGASSHVTLRVSRAQVADVVALCLGLVSALIEAQVLKHGDVGQEQESSRRESVALLRTLLPVLER